MGTTARVGKETGRQKVQRREAMNGAEGQRNPRGEEETATEKANREIVEVGAAAAAEIVNGEIIEVGAAAVTGTATEVEAEVPIGAGAQRKNETREEPETEAET